MLMGFDVPAWMVAAGAGYAWYLFDKEFVHKSELEKKDVPNLGPDHALISEKTVWEPGSEGVPRRVDFPSMRGRR